MLFFRASAGLSAIVGLGGMLMLAGCGEVPGASGPLRGAAMQGSVHGGQQPISGSQVYLYAAGTTGYGKGATSLLNAPGYVLTDATGSFSIANNFTCPTASAPTYLVSVGGNTGSGVNPKSVLMAALGSCGSIGPGTFIILNEVTSVAAVYALSGFMTPGSNAVGTSSTNVTGLVNAFTTADNLASVTSGVALAVTPAGNGIVSERTINTLANIMAACVNTTGGVGACSSLFASATPPGGTAPTDTLTAMLNIARNPGLNVQNLYFIPPPKGTFQPSLTGSPNDWTLSIQYSGGGLNAPQLPAVDAAGNIWVPNAVDPGTLSEFSPVGAPLTTTAGYTGGGLSYPFAVAADLSGNVWAANEGNASVSKHTSNGTALSGVNGFTAAGLRYPYAIALDGVGNVFTSNGNNTVSKLSSTGAALAQFAGGGLDIPFAVAIDGAQNVWIANSGASNSVSKFTNSGTAASVTGFTGGGLFGPVGVALDAGGNSWVANFNNASTSELNSTGTPLSGAGFVTPNDVSAVAVDGSNTVWTANADGSVSHLSNTGASLSPSTGYISAAATGEVGLVVDASGNVWTTDNFVNSLFEYVGAATPAVVPLQAAVKNNLLGQRP